MRQTASERTAVSDTVAANVRAELGARNWSQATFAERMGWPRYRASRRLVTHRDWSVDEVAAVAALLGVTPADLMTPRRIAS